MGYAQVGKLDRESTEGTGSEGRGEGKGSLFRPDKVAGPGTDIQDRAAHGDADRGVCRGGDYLENGKELGRAHAVADHKNQLAG